MRITAEAFVFEKGSIYTETWNYKQLKCMHGWIERNFYKAAEVEEWQVTFYIFLEGKKKKRNGGIIIESCI